MTARIVAYADEATCQSASDAVDGLLDIQQPGWQGKSQRGSRTRVKGRPVPTVTECGMREHPSDGRWALILTARAEALDGQTHGPTTLDFSTAADITSEWYSSE